MEIAAAIGVLIGLLIGVAVMSLVGAVVLRAAAKWVEKMEVPFGNAYVTVLLASVANVILGFLVGLTVGIATRSEEAINVATLLMYPVGFLIQSGIVSSRLRISFGRACLISLAMIGIALVIGLIVGLFAVLISLFIS